MHNRSISSFAVSAASWLSKIKNRQGNTLSNSIASAAAASKPKEEKKVVDKKGGAEKKKKNEGAGSDSSTKARTESLERFMVTAEKAKRYVSVEIIFASSSDSTLFVLTNLKLYVY